ncbi:unnamed protein product [Oppiella nova]|uniref:Uncharacterized protein n=1 Tax=Oppiella nova TaxID=334625 RepID=A0A7R9QUB2_9ACAR|nr:unnamed protein product [Oppiella nova]CAG2174663.1 unnamed protein product [Oppiella nova]
MFDETNRLKSFDNWPHDFISIESLANAGFFYLEGDLVQCAFCLGIGNKVTNLMLNIQNISHCPFIMDEGALNQPISEVHRGQDVCGNMIVPHASFYKELDNRINSYATNVFTCEISTKTLAEAGFYSLGHADYVYYTIGLKEMNLGKNILNICLIVHMFNEIKQKIISATFISVYKKLNRKIIKGTMCGLRILIGMSHIIHHGHMY